MENFTFVNQWMIDHKEKRRNKMSKKKKEIPPTQPCPEYSIEEIQKLIASTPPLIQKILSGEELDPKELPKIEIEMLPNKKKKQNEHRN